MSRPQRTPAQQHLRREPFLLDSPNRNSPSSQFASRPRFILSDDVAQVNDLNLSRSGHSRRHARLSSLGGIAATPGRRRDEPTDLVIEDDFPMRTPKEKVSHLSRSNAPRQRFDDSDDLVIDDDFQQQMSDEERSPSDVDILSDLDDFSDVSQKTKKRRRISISPSDHGSDRSDHQIMGDIVHDPNSSLVSSPGGRHESPTLAQSSAHHESARQTPTAKTSSMIHNNPFTATPSMVAQERDTDSSDRKSNVFRRPPRYLLAEVSSPLAAASVSTPYQGRKKPLFILPESASRGDENVYSSQPTPSSTAISRLRRRGRPRSSQLAANEPLGGLARQFQDWVFKKDYTLECQRKMKGGTGRTPLTVRIDTCQYASLKQWGLFAMARGVEQLTRQEESRQDRHLIGAHEGERNILFLYADTLTIYPSRHHITIRPNLNPGDSVQIDMGCAWEVGGQRSNDHYNDNEHRRSSHRSENDHDGDNEGIDNEDVISEDESRQERLDRRVIPSSASPFMSEDDEKEGDGRHSVLESVAKTTGKTWLVAVEWKVMRQTQAQP